ncbi:hypothetical protein L9F63_012338 [Diploptera punctata]|uniref:Uncharacterized protein n=1 Tax=Diploptera punctata TaxID=6984 RepID=A0AAD8ADK7_DIPPU|nr:hypothetical protein L9F63_012338 [Diploptera punctata]
MSFKVKCVPVIHKVCCCSLRCGTFVAGTIMLILDMVSLVRDSIELSTMEVKEDKENKEQDFKFEEENDKEQDFSDFKLDLRDLTIAQTVYTAVDILTIILLLYGACKEKAGCLLPQVILMMYDIVYLLVIVVLLGVDVKDNALLTFGVLLVGALFVGLFMYVWVIFYSYYRQLEKRRAEPRDSMNLRDEHPTESLYNNTA